MSLASEASVTSQAVVEPMIEGVQWRRVEDDPGAVPWDARCAACGGWIATVPGAARWVRAKCMNWRAHASGRSERRCQKYGVGQTVHKRADPA
jgi:hypothetical protein